MSVSRSRPATRAAATLIAVLPVTVVTVVTVVTGTACQRRDASAAQGPTAPGAGATASKLLVDLAMLATAAPDADAGRKVARSSLDVIDADADAYAYIDGLLADPRFAREVAPEILLHGPPATPAFMDPYFLRSTKAPGGAVIYYLRKPCGVETAVPVNPWWDQGHAVLVCPDSYRPERTKNAQGWYCGGELLSPNVREPNTAFCGCGRGLMHCVRDARNKSDLLASARREAVDTVAHVVSSDLPLTSLFAMNETVRDRNAEFLYARARVLSGEVEDLPDLTAWPENGKLAPRPEGYAGQHAGLLSMPHTLRTESTPRASMRRTYELMWCKPPESVGVDAEQVFALGVTDLREGDGWKKLAAMPVCTDCHARLDYGMQFFGGLLDVRRATDFISSEWRPGSARLYGKSIDDDRGESTATPRAFAELAMRQPEFGSCMTQRVLEHVFDRGWSRSAWQSVAQAFATEGTFRAMMRAALRAYAAEARAAPVPPATLAVAAAPDGAEVTVPPALRAVLDDTCGSCHGTGKRDLTAEQLPVETLHRMLRHVSSGRMPKRAIEAGTRRQIVDALVDLLWTDPADREVARRYFVDLGHGLPAHRYGAVVNAIEAAAGASGTRPRTFVGGSGGASDLSPGLGAAMAVQALRVCGGLDDRAARTACLERATDPALAVKGPLR